MVPKLLQQVLEKVLRITERAVKRLSDDIQVYEMDIQNEDQVTKQ